VSVERRATLWLLLTCVIWGSSFFSMKLGVEGLSRIMDPRSASAGLIFIRFLAATLLYAAFFPGAVRRLDRGTWRWGLLLAVPFFAGFFLQVLGLGATSSAVSAFLTSLTVILTPFVGRLCFGEAVKPGLLAGAVVALAGVWVLAAPGSGAWGAGEALSLGCAAAFAVVIQLTNVATRRAPPEGITFVVFAATTAGSGLLYGVLGGDPGSLARGLAEPNVAWTALFNAVVNSVIALTLMNRWQRELSPSRAALLYTLEPLFAAGFAALAGEPLEVRHLLGGGIILGGNLLVEALSARRAPPVDAPAPGSLS
jgi:drug/metabolite transporter (DMT)-like permease